MWGFPGGSAGKKSSCNAGESEVTQLCLTLWDPMYCSLPGSSVHGILQARILEWVTISFEPGSPALEADVLSSEVQSLAWEDLLEKGKSTHSSILAWRIPWTVQSMVPKIRT